MITTGQVRAARSIPRSRVTIPDVRILRGTVGWEPLPDHEPASTCGMYVCDDPQSGPIYCSNLAEFEGVAGKTVIRVCPRHRV